MLSLAQTDGLSHAPAQWPLSIIGDEHIGQMSGQNQNNATEPVPPSTDVLAKRTLASEPAHHGAMRTRYAHQFGGGVQLKEALVSARRALAVEPPNPWDLHNLGEIFRRLGDQPGSYAHYRRALALQPDFARTFQSLLAISNGIRSGAELKLLALRAAAIEPLSAESWVAAAAIDFHVGELGRVERYFKRALAADPQSADVLREFAVFRRNCGEPEVSLRFHDRALAIVRSERLEREMLVSILYHPTLTQEERFGRHRAYAQRHYADHPRPQLRARTGDRIRIGYLSAGLYDHPTGRVFIGLIEGHDRRAVDVSLFSTRETPDWMSRRFAAAADRWVDVAGQPAPAVAEAIRKAGIDVLVYLVGRFDPVCWPVASLRPAPIQVSFGDVATSGLPALDYMVSDPILHPRHGAERVSERLIRLPCTQQHELPPFAPPVTPLPALANGYVTFGSLNNSPKLNDHVLALWAATLAAVPGSRLLIRTHALAGPPLVGRVRRCFAEAGVDPARIDFQRGGDANHRRVLETYDLIDIALDTLPFSGGMTTFEAMCQGVPVVTLPGEHMAGRWGALYAVQTGHPSLIAKTPAEFVAIARDLASDVKALAGLRSRLRQDFLASPLCDGRLKAHHLERAFQHLVSRCVADSRPE